MKSRKRIHPHTIVSLILVGALGGLILIFFCF